jgi:hypothetical protein
MRDPKVTKLRPLLSPLLRVKVTESCALIGSCCAPCQITTRKIIKTFLRAREVGRCIKEKHGRELREVSTAPRVRNRPVRHSRGQESRRAVVSYEPFTAVELVVVTLTLCCDRVRVSDVRGQRLHVVTGEKTNEKMERSADGE